MDALDYETNIIKSNRSHVKEETRRNGAGNTVAVCRNCYIHPAIIGAYMEGSLLKTLERCRKRAGGGRRTYEAAVLAILNRR